MGRIGAAIGIGVKYLYLVFVDLSEQIRIESGFTIGKPKIPAAYIVAGLLHLDNRPLDYWETDGGTGTSPYKHKEAWAEGADVIFKTGSAHVSDSDKERIKQLVATWARRFE